MATRGGDINLKATLDNQNVISGIKNISKVLKDFGANMGETVGKVGEGLKSSFKDNVSSIKRTGLALFGVYSTYRALSKASSAYLAQDLETSNKIKAAWIGLGSLFAPLLEKVANFVLKAVAYLNVFITALTGVNLLARAQEKSFKSAAKGVSAYKSALAGIDEITDVSIQSGGAGSPDFGWADEFSKIDLDEGWVNIIKKFAEYLKGVDWKKVGTELLILAGVILTLKSALSVLKAYVDISKLISNLKELGLLSGGIASVGAVLTTIAGVLVSIVGLVISVERLIEFLKHPAWNTFFQILTGIGIVVAGIAIVMGGWTVVLVALGAALVALTTSILIQDNANQKASKSIKEIIKNEERLKQLTDEVANATDAYTRAVDRKTEATSKLDKLYKDHKISGEEIYKMVKDNVEAYDTLTDQEKEAYKAHLDLISAEEDMVTSKAEITQKTKELTETEEKNRIAKEKLIEIGKESDKAIKLTKAEYKTYKEAVVEAYTEGRISAEEAQDLISKALGAMATKNHKTFAIDLPDAIKTGLDTEKYKTLGAKLSDWWSRLMGGLKKDSNIEITTSTKSSGGSSKGYAEGLQQVPHDMVALVHKGEAIVPARFNKDGYFNANTNATVDNNEVVRAINVLTDVLIDKDLSVNIDKDTIGSVSVDYINSRSRVLGKGVI